ncbi:MAG: GatB/YqeY domain-containing protein [Armatimonadetes bacterium]|nr:GatB/YqeY domain-containing protein [Armatimonadota bacterium]
MSLREKLEEDYKAAMKAKDTLRVSVIRMARSEIRNAEIAKRRSLTEEEIAEVITREIKRRQESIEQFKQGGRTDLVDKETAEMKILSEYLPEQLSEDEIAGIAQEVIAELKAASKADKGRVMSALMPRVRGRADGRLVSEIVDRLLERSSA